MKVATAANSPIIASRCVRLPVGVAAAALAGVVGAAGAAETHVDGVRVVDVGVYTATVVAKEPADTPSGVVLLQKDIRLTTPTTDVCPKPGVVFGLHYALEGAPAGAPVEVVVRVNFPPPGVRYPGSKKRERSAEQVYQREIGAVRFADYTIGGLWDALPGHWSIQFWSQGRMIFEQGFDLHRAACRGGG